MAESATQILGWAIPALVVFGVAALGVIILVWALRRARRSPRARAAAEAQRAAAGVTLVQLDDAVDDLDLEVGLSGALYGGDAPPSLRRARLIAQHVRDDSFEQYREISRDSTSPVEIKRASARIQQRAGDALGTISIARTEHSGWVRANVSAAAQVAGARERLAALRATMGDPAALVAELSARFSEDEWAEAARAARAAATGADEADALLKVAAAAATDPARTALPELAGAERALRRAETDTRILEEAHRLATQAAQAVPGEFTSTRAALRQATAIRAELAPDDATRLGEQIGAIDDELDRLETDAARRPTRTIETIARLRGRLDAALGDARTAQQRMRGARTALPGTLAAARNAVAHAEAALSHTRAGADARSRLASAERELAAARGAQDPVEALDAARRAMRDAQDAQALADYDRLKRK